MGKLTDFNDMAQVVGLDAVREVVAQAVQPVQTPAPEWPDPILPGTIRTPDIPADVLPSWLGAMAGAVAESSQTPPALAVMVGLSVLATVLQRRFEVAPFGDDYTEPLALWTLTALPSGARKTSVIKALTEPLLHWEKVQRDRMRSEIVRVSSARAVAKKRIERLLAESAKAKDDAEREGYRADIQREEEAMPEEVYAPRLFTGDVTGERLQSLLVEHGERMAVLSDEGGIFANLAGLYSGGQANNDVYLQGHAGTAMRVDRAGRSAHVDKPALSFGLALQPGVLSEAAGSRRFRDSGLLARFLYAMPISNVGKRDVRRHVPIPRAVRDDYEAAIFRLLEDIQVRPGKPRVLEMTDPARDHWLDFAQEIEDNQGEGGRYESISDWTSKLPGAVARIAALLELGEMGLHSEAVSQSAMERAVKLGCLLISHAQAAFGLLGTDATDTDAAAILKWVRANDLQEFSRPDCQKAMEGRFRTVERLTKALQRLEHQYVVRCYERRNKGARATPMCAVNPKALST
ncbi:DUF3987 domain-containing protein [Aromatoleum anaerobium]|uniref:DUF3987 domain-containing protein n=1 Tax=Aromatoleum anaerobium TaxID=182180 RepID=A0ABX1PS56_9RHOO|nr:YfjI family protein [Aromatoleum anaerobium]MCK0508473.1 YfjI family protein [Aromatoleum anaerobium]